MRLTSILLAILVLAVAFGQNEVAVPPGPEVLRVGDRSLSLAEFDQRFDVYAAGLAAQQGMQLTPQLRKLLARLRPSYLEQLATEFVLLEESERRGLRVDPAGIDTQLATLRASFPSEEEFQRGLEQAGFASESLLRLLITEAQQLRQMVDVLRHEIVIRDYQLDLYYQANRDRYRQEEQVCARHILVASRQQAQALAKQLEDGADFAVLAKAVSTDTGSAERGGDLGCFPRGMMVAPFEEAAFRTPVGQVSGIVESRFGFHLILPYERKDARVVPLAQVKDEVRAGVENLVLQKLVEGLREAASVTLNPEAVTVAASQGKELEAR